MHQLQQRLASIACGVAVAAGLVTSVAPAAYAGPCPPPNQGENTCGPQPPSLPQHTPGQTIPTAPGQLPGQPGDGATGGPTTLPLTTPPVPDTDGGATGKAQTPPAPGTGNGTPIVPTQQPQPQATQELPPLTQNPSPNPTGRLGPPRTGSSEDLSTGTKWLKTFSPKTASFPDIKTWGACGIFSSEMKTVRTFNRRSFKVGGDFYGSGTSALYCGNDKYGFRHIKKRHLKEWEDLDPRYSWRETADMDIEWALTHPEIVCFDSARNSITMSALLTEKYLSGRSRGLPTGRMKWSNVVIAAQNGKIITALPTTKPMCKTGTNG